MCSDTWPLRHGIFFRVPNGYCHHGHAPVKIRAYTHASVLYVFYHIFLVEPNRLFHSFHVISVFSRWKELHTCIEVMRIQLLLTIPKKTIHLINSFQDNNTICHWQIVLLTWKELNKCY